MKTYCGIDLYSNNNVIVFINEEDTVLLEKKLSNSLGVALFDRGIKYPIKNLMV